MVIGGMRQGEPYLNLITYKNLPGDMFRYIRSLLFIRSAISALSLTLPAIISVLAYMTYSATGHQLDPGVIFSSLTLFNLLRLPLMLWRKSIDLLIH